MSAASGRVSPEGVGGSFALAAAVAVVLAVGVGAPALAHNGCATDFLYSSDPNCKAHWQDSHMLYHWGDAIQAEHHRDERARFSSAVNRWANACCPDSPWHVHFDTAAGTHVNMVNFFGGILGAGTPEKEDANHHMPLMKDLWLRHDVDEVDCGGVPCVWYSKADPDVPANKLDSWSAWQEETGHAQNMVHWNENSCDFTMSGRTCPGNSNKRQLNSHLEWHACDPYRRVHDAC